MPEVTVYEIYDVTVQVDLPHPDDRRIRPRSVWFDSAGDAAEAMKRALALPFPPHAVTVMTSRKQVQQFDFDESADLADWPAERHIVTGPFTEQDL